jgi:hypothetical protein
VIVTERAGTQDQEHGRREDIGEVSCTEARLDSWKEACFYVSGKFQAYSEVLRVSLRTQGLQRVGDLGLKGPQAGKIHFGFFLFFSLPSFLFLPLPSFLFLPSFHPSFHLPLLPPFPYSFPKKDLSLYLMRPHMYHFQNGKLKPKLLVWWGWVFMCKWLWILQV